MPMLDQLISFICLKMITVGRKKTRPLNCCIFQSLQRSEPDYLLDVIDENDMKEINPDEAGNKEEVIMTKCSKREMQETCLFFVIQVLQGVFNNSFSLPPPKKGNSKIEEF